MAIGYVWETVYGWVDTGCGILSPSDVDRGIQPLTHHFAHPDTKRRLFELLSATGELDDLVRVHAKHVTDEDVLRVHEKDYLDRVKYENTLPKGGDAGDGVTSFGKGGLSIAALSAGGVLEMTKEVVSGRLETGYALVNPPGHHATRATGMGFCIFNNVSIAAAYAKASLGVEKIAVVDWDVHHGNGTQDIWYRDPSVLTISLHQNRNFPVNSGFLEERGEGDGLGYSLNIPLPPGSGDAAYTRAFDEVVVPALEDFKPDVIFIASGFDASAYDPLGRQVVTAQGYRELTAKALGIASQLSSKIVFAQEGGYSAQYLPMCGRAVIREMLGKEFLTDELTENAFHWEGDVLLPHQKAAIDAAKSAWAG
jgi:acetoin utilization deacetylase AcuC-like enzyme